MNNEFRSFNMKEYNKKEIVCGEGYELAMLKDICESQNGYAFTTNEYENNGIPLITITHIKNERIEFNNNHYIKENKKYDKFIIKNNDIVISLTGKKPKLCSIALYNKNDKMYLNQRCGLLRNFKQINKYYFVTLFNGFLLNHINESIGNGSNQENVSLTDILKLQIPIPKSQAKIKEWTTKISIPYDEKIMKTSKIAELEKQVLDEIKRIGEEEECDEVEYNKVGEIMCGKNLTKENAITGSYNVYGGGNTSYTHNEYNLEGFNILVSRVGNNNVSLVDEKLYLTDNGFSLLVKDKKIKKYIGYYIFMNNDNVLKLGNGSAQKVISKTKLNKLKLHIPCDKSLIQKLDPTFQQIEQLHVEVKNADILYNKLIKELADEAIPPSKQTQQNKMKTIEEEIMDTSDISSIDNEKETKKSIKKIKIKKVSPDSSSDEIKNKIKNKIKN
jgi:restriction endonuclease S subunit